MVFDSKQMASKFIDGDLTSKNDLEQLVACKKTKATYSRYQMISHVMKSEAVAPDVCIADSVMSALASEATVLAPTPATPKPEEVIAQEETSNVISMPARFGKQIGGMAIAASVALVALLNFGSGSNNPDQTASPIQTFASLEASPLKLDKAQLQEAHRVFTELSQSGQATPIIQTVSNQKAVPLVVKPKESTLEENSKPVEPIK